MYLPVSGFFVLPQSNKENIGTDIRNIEYIQIGQ